MDFEDCVAILRKIGIKVVISFSRGKDYTPEFKNAGFKSHYLNFENGDLPSNQQVENFFKILESYDPHIRIGVYSQSGLRKAGTMVGCYLIKYFGFTADTAIGWLRILRPGSIQGIQQIFLKEYAKLGFKVENTTLNSLLSFISDIYFS